MKTASIFEKKWIDLIFEGKNKAYGAYQLRQENAKTTLMAFVYGLIFIISLSGFGLLLSSFGSKPAVVVKPKPVKEPIICTLIRPNVIKPKTEKSIAKREKTAEIKEKILSNPIVVKANENPDEIVKTTAVNNTNTTAEVGNSTGVATVASTDVGGGNTDKGGKDATTIVTSVMLDKQPSFPGGMDKFYDFVGRNYKTPDLELDTTVKVYVSFVIEPDGSMSNIRVTRDPGYGLGKEAVRVLLSLKTKWEAGVLDGQKVRTAYNLPIAVKVD